METIGVEPFPIRGEINNGSVHRGAVVEKELHLLQRTSTAFGRNLRCPFDLVVTRGMRAATVRVCAVAE